MSARVLGCSGMRARRYTASGLDYVAMGYRPLPPPPPIDNERRYIGLSIFGAKGRCVLFTAHVKYSSAGTSAHVREYWRVGCGNE
jgi:hypothetical protein